MNACKLAFDPQSVKMYMHSLLTVTQWLFLFYQKITLKYSSKSAQHYVSYQEKIYLTDWRESTAQSYWVTVSKACMLIENVFRS